MAHPMVNADRKNANEPTESSIAVANQTTRDTNTDVTIVTTPTPAPVSSPTTASENNAVYANSPCWFDASVRSKSLRLLRQTPPSSRRTKTGTPGKRPPYMVLDVGSGHKIVRNM